MFLVAKKEQRSVKAKSLSAALSIVHLCGHVSGLAAWPYVSRSLFAAPDEGDDLCAGAVGVRAERGVGGALGDVLLDSPQHRVSVVGACLHIGERIGRARCRGLLGAPQEGHDLRTGAGGIGAEHGLAGALGDAVLHGPQHRVIVVAANLHIGKGHDCGLGCGAACCAPQEGDGLRAGADAVRIEAARACAGGNAVFYRPQHRVVVVAARRNVDKFVRPCKANLDGVGTFHVLKGVGLYRADAPAVDLDIGDNIALIRGDGEGLIPPLADADIAGGRDGAVHACGGLDSRCNRRRCCRYRGTQCRAGLPTHRHQA